MLTPLWIRANGKPVRLGQMSTAHILNVLRYLRTGDGEYGPMVRPGCSGFTNAEWMQLLEAELRYRLLQCVPGE